MPGQGMGHARHESCTKKTLRPCSAQGVECPGIRAKLDIWVPDKHYSLKEGLKTCPVFKGMAPVFADFASSASLVARQIPAAGDRSFRGQKMVPAHAAIL